MIWNQTWPLFKPPYLSNILLLCYLTFVSFFVAHGVYMWYPQILALYYPNMHLPITTCEAISLAWSQQDYEMIDTVWVDPLSDTIPTLFTLIQFYRTSEVIEINCQLDNDPMTYQIILVMGTTFCCIYGFVALNINRLGKSILFRMFQIITRKESVSFQICFSNLATYLSNSYAMHYLGWWVLL